ncbi:MAG: AAA family ATPase [Candidatus Omnitrophica bacterium]|nr:AAA family ATPase [Candidatus Omnitrophota bacterium]
MQQSSSYLSYWGLKELPFSTTPDVRYFYFSKEHEEAFVRLKFVIEHKKPLCMITGEYGSGKTLLCNFLISKLSATNYQFVYLGNPFVPKEELVHNLVLFLTRVGVGGIEKLPTKYTELVQLFVEIVNRNFQIGKHTVIFFDEAHLVEDIKVFEQLRVLLNSAGQNTSSLSIILLGQTELREKIASLGQFKSRITYHYHIKNLDKEEVAEYIKHRLLVAGHPTGELFCKFAVEEIYNLTLGLPRTINNICDISLMLGMAKSVDKINKEIVLEAKEEVLL